MQTGLLLLRHPPTIRHLNVRGTGKETVVLSFPGHSNDMRAATLKITIGPNVPVSGALIFPLNLPKTMVSVFNCLTSPFVPPTKQVCQAVLTKTEWLRCDLPVFQYAEVQVTYFCFKVDFPSYSSIIYQ